MLVERVDLERFTSGVRINVQLLSMQAIYRDDFSTTSSVFFNNIFVPLDF